VILRSLTANGRLPICSHDRAEANDLAPNTRGDAAATTTGRQSKPIGHSMTNNRESIRIRRLGQPEPARLLELAGRTAPQLAQLGRLAAAQRPSAVAQRRPAALPFEDIAGHPAFGHCPEMWREARLPAAQGFDIVEADSGPALARKQPGAVAPACKPGADWRKPQACAPHIR